MIFEVKTKPVQANTTDSSEIRPFVKEAIMRSKYVAPLIPKVPELGSLFFNIAENGYFVWLASDWIADVCGSVNSRGQFRIKAFEFLDENRMSSHEFQYRIFNQGLGLVEFKGLNANKELGLPAKNKCFGSISIKIGELIVRRMKEISTEIEWLEIDHDAMGLKYIDPERTNITRYERKEYLGIPIENFTAAYKSDDQNELPSAATEEPTNSSEVDYDDPFGGC